MTYFCQLLPSLEEARVLREALASYVTTQEDENKVDMAWNFLAKLTTEMNKNKGLK